MRSCLDTPPLLKLLASKDEALLVGERSCGHVWTLLLSSSCLLAKMRRCWSGEGHAVMSGHSPLLSLSCLPAKIRRCWSGEGHAVMSGCSSSPLLELLAGKDKALLAGGRSCGHVWTLLLSSSCLLAKIRHCWSGEGHAVMSGHSPLLSSSCLPAKIRRCWSGEGHAVMPGHSPPSPRAACQQR